MNDRDIIALYEARDERAIAESEAQYGHYCTAVAMNILGNAQDAEECVNDTWLKTWNSIPPAKPLSLRIWFGRMVRQLSINRWHSLHNSRRNVNLETALDELQDILPAEEDDGSLRDTLADFLSRLDPDERRLFMGRYWFLHTPADLARAFGVSKNAVALRLLRTRDKLRAHLREAGYTVPK